MKTFSSINRTAILFMMLFSAKVQAAERIATFSSPLSGQQINHLSLRGIQAQLFDSFDSEYFKRTYKLQGSEKNLDSLKEESTSSPFFPQSLEVIHQVEGLSLHVTGEAKRPTKDPYSHYQWGLHNQGQYLLIDQNDIRSSRIDSILGEDIQLAKANPATPSAVPVLVAVIDSGIDYEHPDLKDSMFTTSGECDERGLPPFRAVGDIDQNGHNSDCLGWDFTAPGVGTNRPLDDQGHGTHVAGIIAARWNQSFVAGVSPNARILAIKVLKKQEQADRAALAFSDRVAKGVLYAIKKGAKIINLSLGWPASMDTRYVREAFIAAEKSGVLVVAAAGNNSSSRALYPCSYSSVLCVGATTINGELASFSNYGAHVDVLAPGEQILSTFPMRLTPNFFSVSGMEVKNGTSQAAPMVAGVLSVLKEQFPLEKNRSILRRLLSTSAELKSPTSASFGLVKLEPALATENEQVLVRPMFKDNQIVTVSKEKTFVINLRIQNLSTGTVTVDLSLPPVDLIGVNLTLSQNEVSFDVDEDKDIVINGTLEHFALKQEQLICIAIKSASFSRQFCQEFMLNRVPDLEREAFGFTIPAQMSPATVPGQEVNTIRSAFDPFKQQESPFYYKEPRIIPGTTSDYVLNVWNPVEQAEKIMAMPIPGAERLINLLIIDANNDNVSDFVAISLGSKKKSDGSPDRFMLFSYFNREGGELYPGRSHFIYRPKEAVPELAQTIWRFHQADFGKIALPAFFAEGPIPLPDINSDPFANESPSQKDFHLYYLNILNGKNELEARIIDNYSRRAQWRTLLNLSWFEDIDLLAIMRQSFLDFKQGFGQIVLSAGQGAQKKTYLWDLGDQELLSLPSSHETGALDGSYFIPVTRVGDAKAQYNAATAVVGFFTDINARHMTLDRSKKGPISITGQGELQHALERDHLVATLPAFQTHTHHIYLYQTKTNLLALYEGEEGQKLFKRPIHRSSFLPGKVFNEMFFPITINQKDSSIPGIYVDSTQLYQGTLSVLALTEEGPLGLIHNALSLPANCKALNPAIFNGKESFTFQCQKTGEQTAKLYFLPFR